MLQVELLTQSPNSNILCFIDNFFVSLIAIVKKNKVLDLQNPSPTRCLVSHKSSTHLTWLPYIYLIRLLLYFPPHLMKLHNMIPYSPDHVVTNDSPDQVVASTGHGIHGATHPFGGRFADVRGGTVLSQAWQHGGQELHQTDGQGVVGQAATVGTTGGASPRQGAHCWLARSRTRLGVR